MIVVKLQGGLGNQLFQYATARALAHHHRTSVAFDLSFFEGQPIATQVTPRNYELLAFGIAPGPAPLMDSIAYGLKHPPFQKKQIQRFVSHLLSATEYREKSFRYDPGIWKHTRPRTHLVGYFQSESYFKDIRSQLLEELAFVQQPQPALLSQIQNPHSVSLHVRRGDYALNSETQRFHGLCMPDYYTKAVNYLTERLGTIHIFVFSDDSRWARQNLLLPHPVTFVEENTGKDSYKDMLLMSRCSHHIIANSSFSWWGAWLNPLSDKIVVAPRQWFADPTAQQQSHDIVPSSWIRV